MGQMFDKVQPVRRIVNGFNGKEELLCAPCTKSDYFGRALLCYSPMKFLFCIVLDATGGKHRFGTGSSTKPIRGSSSERGTDRSCNTIR